MGMKFYLIFIFLFKLCFNIEVDSSLIHTTTIFYNIYKVFVGVYCASINVCLYTSNIKHGEIDVKYRKAWHHMLLNYPTQPLTNFCQNFAKFLAKYIIFYNSVQTYNKSWIVQLCTESYVRMQICGTWYDWIW